MKQLEVHILQQSYVLSCAEGSEARLSSAVERVDAAMLEIRDAGKVRLRERIAVLAAVNMAFDVDSHAQALALAEQAHAHDKAQMQAHMESRIQTELQARIGHTLDQAQRQAQAARRGIPTHAHRAA